MTRVDKQPTPSVLRQALAGPVRIVKSEVSLPTLILILASCMPTYIMLGLITLIPAVFTEPTQNTFYYFGKELNTAASFVVLGTCVIANLTALALPGFLPKANPKPS